MSWLGSSDPKLTHLDEGMVERYLRHRSGKQCIQPGDRAALKRLLSVLRDAGMNLVHEFWPDVRRKFLHRKSSELAQQ